MKPHGSPEKARITGLALDTLPTLAVGDSAFFEIPKSRPGRASLRESIERVAWQKLGVGRYRMKSDAAGVRVTRL